MRRRISLRNSGTLEPSHEQDLPAYEQDASENEISLFELGTALVKKRRLIAYPTLVVMLLTAIVLFLIPNRYSSTVTILPSGETDNLSGLKSLAGMGALIKADESSSELFPEILRSRSVNDAVLSRTYAFSDDGEDKQMTLQEYFSEDERDLLYRSLDEITEFGIDKKTGVIRLAVETEYPALSQAVLSSYVAELENFNLHKRRSQAKESEMYLARQLQSKKQELTGAEQNLERFQMENRNWNATSNPEIVNELARLQREVEIKSTAYLYLTQEYEMAKFEAQKDVPIVRLLDSPSLPTRKSGPARTLILALVGLMTLVITFFVALAAEGLGKISQSSQNEAYTSFRENVAVAFPKAVRAVNRLRRTERELV